jgi:ribosome-associated protein
MNSEFIPILQSEVQLTAVRAQGAGGQNVNKVSSAIHLRFDIPASALPFEIKERLLQLRDSRITQDGVLIIKAQQHRTQELNRVDAFTRLAQLIESIEVLPKARRATRPSYGSTLRRLQSKANRSIVKTLRGRVTD